MMLQGFLASLLAGLATGLGAIPLLLVKKVPRPIYDGLLGFSAGVMLFVSIAHLLLPSLETENGAILAAIGLLSGALLFVALERIIPHLEPHFSPEPLSLSMRRGILLAIAITIHNLPEGLAVGVGYAVPEGSRATAIAIAIAAQNIPEGLAVALPLREAGVSRAKCLLIATLSGIAEPIAAIIGIYSLSTFSISIPFGLAFASGAMLYVVSDELIPESHSHGNERNASLGVIAGFIAMILLHSLMHL